MGKRSVDPEVERLLDLKQGTDEWFAARLGSLGASSITAATAQGRGGAPSVTRRNKIAELVVERLTGKRSRGFSNKAMEWGTETEDEARRMYEFQTGQTARQVGLIRHPRIAGTHASPDSFVGDDGCLEIKCPYTATHLDYLFTKTIPGDYYAQNQWHLACSGRAWCDWVSYDPEMPARHQLLVLRVVRDEPMIKNLERAASEFVAEVEATIRALDAL